MSRTPFFLVAGAVLLLVTVCVVGGIYWYLFGPNEIASAELVPANTIAFATIPNAVELLQAFQSSQAKTLLDSPNMKPLRDALVPLVGTKNVELLRIFLPNLSGQSFIAVTHFDYDHPQRAGLIAAMKPKAGLGDFGAFLEKLRETYPDILKQGTTGKGSVAGFDYDWIQGPGAPDKICVAHIRGWIVTSWGEAPLQDWIERFEKKSTTSSLAEDVDYRKSLERIGDDPMTLVYVNYRGVMDVLQKVSAKTNPAMANYLARKLDNLGGAAVATRFENGEIVDRYSFLMPRPTQLDSGMGVDPCPFDTLKFTGHDTHIYWASSVNWQQYYKALKHQTESPDQPPATTAPNPITATPLSFLQNWVRDSGLDAEHNIVDALGPEVSVQMEWGDNATYPEVGLFVKLDKPDDFKPVVSAIIDSVRKAYATTAVIKQINSNNQNFATLNFVPSGIFTPTITEDGPYFGVFLTANQAVRSFQRDPSLGLAHNDNFNRQIGDKRNGAQQIAFLDSPYILDRAYKTAMPYVSLAGMFNKDIAAALQGRQLPDDLSWLAPMGTWACVVTTDESGVQVYSASGIGNQGVILSGTLGGAANLAQSMGLLPKSGLSGFSPFSDPPHVPSVGAVLPVTASPNPASLSSGVTPPPAPVIPPLPASGPLSPPSSDDTPATNSASNAPPPAPAPAQ